MTATTGRIEARLAELGFALPPVTAPLAAYVPAVLDGDRVWVSGQLPFVDGALPVNAGPARNKHMPAAARTAEYHCFFISHSLFLRLRPLAAGAGAISPRRQNRPVRPGGRSTLRPG